MKSPRAVSNKLVVITGPTASGKTALGIEIAQQYDGEIISADSRTIYQGFDIGTAKPSQQERAGIAHHLIDIRQPGESYSVAEFKADALRDIRSIRQRQHLPIVVGGTGLYIDALLFDYQFRQGQVRQSKDYETLTLEQLQSIASQRFAEEIPQNEFKNRRRLIQILTRGLTKSTDRNQIKIDCIIIGLAPDMLYLKEKISKRVDVMLNNNFIQEVKDLLTDFGGDCPQFNIIGYRHALAFIDGEISLDELKERFVRDDFQLARRQMTWFRRNSAVIWCSDAVEAGKAINDYLLGGN